MTKLYLAYGSNLNKQAMRGRCPSARPVGSATLYGWKLQFRGRPSPAFLTIEKTGDLRDSVPVGVWEISPADEKALDWYEGAPGLYRKASLQVTYHDQDLGMEREGRALVYIMDGPCSPALPYDGYVNSCARGYVDFGLDLAPLQAALARARKEAKS